MPTIKKFEDMEVWQRAREMTKIIYKFSNTGAFALDFGLRDQLRRASVSIMANIAEGFERGGDKEFIQFLSIAGGSCAEVRSHLYVALDIGYLERNTFEQLYALSITVNRMLSGLMKYLKQSNLKGKKYKPQTT